MKFEEFIFYVHMSFWNVKICIGIHADTSVWLDMYIS